MSDEPLPNRRDQIAALPDDEFVEHWRKVANAIDIDFGMNINAATLRRLIDIIDRKS